MVNTLHQDYSGDEVANDRGVLHVWERGEVHTEFWFVTRRISVGKPRRRWEDNINMDLQETRWSGVDRIRLALHIDKLWLLLVR